MDVALATYSELPELNAHDQLLIPALARRGLEAVPVRWDAQDFDWSVPKLTVIRSTWDYHQRLDAYLKWVHHVGRVGRLANPPHVVQWNHHKGYLRDLDRAGVPIAPTEWLERGSTAKLASLLEARGWSAAVVKSTVSAGSLGVFPVSKKNPDEAQAKLDALLPTADVMVQPFLRSLDEEGEVSALFFGGRFAFAIHRPAGLLTPGLMPPQTRTVELNAEQRALADATMRAIPSGCLYARIDIAQDNEGRAAVMEAELIEPALFFCLYPQSAELFTDAVVAQLSV